MITFWLSLCLSFKQRKWNISWTFLNTSDYEAHQSPNKYIFLFFLHVHGYITIIFLVSNKIAHLFLPHLPVDGKLTISERDIYAYCPSIVIGSCMYRSSIFLVCVWVRVCALWDQSVTINLSVLWLYTLRLIKTFPGYSAYYTYTDTSIFHPQSHHLVYQH